ncbi:MAG: isocitrate/isopropylmalate dehydrogenase family protein [Phycisphaeraceae bacterium]|nr:isocitrate/isopropylmalate dehydrogenase family protein [Phycisphaeraceae bacterium]
MTTYQIGWLGGDGIGPEVLDAARSVLDAIGFRAEYIPADIGWKYWCEEGNPLPERTLDVLRSTNCAMFGAITSKPASDAARELAEPLRARNLKYSSPIVQLRREFNLFANIRPAQSFAGAGQPIDVIVVRENTEGLYSGLEIHPTPQSLVSALDPARRLPHLREANPADLALSVRVTTRVGCERIVRRAFEVARSLGRKRVTLVEKANVLRATGGLMTEVAREVAAAFPDIQFREAHIDTACMDLVRRPSEFDVIVAENLFGDILSDLTAGLTGGPGLAPSANIGETYAVFEPVHGSAPDIAGKGVANPCAAVLSASMMLEWLGERTLAQRLHAAVRRVLTEARTKTPDLGGTATTKQMASAIIAAAG